MINPDLYRLGGKQVHAARDEPASDKRWRTLTEQANRVYQTGDFGAARPLYEQALAEADRLLALAPDPERIPVPVICTISCHNLAALAERFGDRQAAETHYRGAYDRLMKTAKSPMANLALRLACVKQFDNALSMLVTHLRDCVHDPGEIAALIDAAQSTAIDVLNVVRHAVADGNGPSGRKPS